MCRVSNSNRFYGPVSVSCATFNYPSVVAGRILRRAASGKFARSWEWQMCGRAFGPVGRAHWLRNSVMTEFPAETPNPHLWRTKSLRAG